MTSAVALLLLLVASGAAEAWLQPGYDNGRTGSIPFEGPATDDVAFQVELPGTPTGGTIILDGVAYVLTRDLSGLFDGDTGDLRTEALWTVNLATAEVDMVFEIPDDGTPGLLFPGVVVYQEGQELVGFDFFALEERWRVMALPDEEELYQRGYRGGALLQENRLYIGFSARDRVGYIDEDTNFVTDGRRMGGVLALDIETGDELWTWDDRREVQEEVPGIDPEDPTDATVETTFSADRISADDRRIYTYGRADGDTSYSVDAQYDREERRYEIWALDIQSGEPHWMRNDTKQTNEWVHSRAGSFRLESWSGSTCCPYPVVTPTGVHLRLDAFASLNKADGNPVWTSPAGRTDQIHFQGSTAMGARGDVLIGTSEQTVYRLNAMTGGIDWMKTDPDTNKYYRNAPVVLDSSTAYVSFAHNRTGFGGPGIEARDVASGDLLWSWRHQPDVGIIPDSGSRTTIPNNPAFGPGLIVQGSKDGIIHVIGQTNASLGAPRVEADHYPGVAQEVTLDLSDTRPGAFGPATKYRVFWGDGAVSDWQASPVFSHVYQEEEEFVARAQAGNDANQTASTFVTFHVGQDPPPDLNFLQQMFARENQDMTFGVLGILLAVSGGVVGVTRRNRKRNRLQNELETLQEGHRELLAKPGECEAFLDTRKARARSLVLDGDLGEEQGALVEARAEELRRELRSSALEEEFGFLPYNLVTKAREMLEDGRVTTLEAEAFFAALEEVEGLSRTQQAVVRKRVEAWFARDTGGRS